MNRVRFDYMYFSLILFDSTTLLIDFQLWVQISGRCEFLNGAKIWSSLVAAL